MAKLTDEQLTFLASQDVGIDKTFDAQGLPTWLYKEVMSSADLWVAYGVRPCKKGEHTLRVRNGTCLQCDTRQLGFLKRWKRAGHIYVASSVEISATKVGVATDPGSRIRSLNNLGYGGSCDWELFKSLPCDNMGLLEHRIHTMLSTYRISSYYMREGHLIQCKELFSRSPAAAWKTVTKALAGAA